MAPTITGTSRITLAEDLLIYTLSQSTEFQSFTGTVNATLAAQRVYCVEIPGTADDQDHWTEYEWATMFPCVILGPPDDGGSVSYRHEATGGPAWEFVHDLRFTLRFERYLPEGLDEQDAVRDFQNRVGVIMEELIEQSGYSERFACTSAQPNGPPQIGSYARYATLGAIQAWRWEIVSEVGG